MSKNKLIVIGALAIVIVSSYFLVKQDPSGKGSAGVAKAPRLERVITLMGNDRQSNSKTTAPSLDAGRNRMMDRTKRVNAPPLKDGTYREDAKDELTNFYSAENNPSEDPNTIPVALWQSNASAASLDDDRIEHTESVRSDPKFLANLQVGQSLDFFIPQIGRSYLSTIESTSNQMGEVKVWKGNIYDKNEKSNVIITQGTVMTHVILSTAEGVYSAQIDNETGVGEVLDEREFTENMSDEPEEIPFNYQLRRGPL